MRSMERTVEEILLPAVGALGEGRDRTSPEYGFGWRWATGWLAAQTRTAPPAHRSEGVLLFDATRALDLDALHAQALEMVLRRAGLRALTLPVDLDPLRIGRALVALTPSAVVLVGRHASLDTFGRLVYAARRVRPRASRSTTSAARSRRRARRRCRASASGRWRRARSCSRTSTSAHAASSRRALGRLRRSVAALRPRRSAAPAFGRGRASCAALHGRISADSLRSVEGIRAAARTSCAPLRRRRHHVRRSYGTAPERRRERARRGAPREPSDPSRYFA